MSSRSSGRDYIAHYYIIISVYKERYIKSVQRSKIEEPDWASPIFIAGNYYFIEEDAAGVLWHSFGDCNLILFFVIISIGNLLWCGLL
jgi:hypothetical protein